LEERAEQRRPGNARRETSAHVKRNKHGAKEEHIPVHRDFEPPEVLEHPPAL
jgi:hypothetical protein